MGFSDYMDSKFNPLKVGTAKANNSNRTPQRTSQPAFLNVQPSIWGECDESKLQSLQKKDEKCGGIWNQIKNAFGYGQKMTAQEKYDLQNLTNQKARSNEYYSDKIINPDDMGE